MIVVEFLHRFGLYHGCPTRELKDQFREEELQMSIFPFHW
jgi:hypothetical protein